MVSASVDTVGVDPTTGRVIVLLRAETGERLPMVIGPLEAQHIVVAMSGQAPPRPLTPDLMISALRFLGAELVRVEIIDLREGTFYARVVVMHREVEHEIDSRPSDALALALRSNAPLLVEERVLDEAGVDPTGVRVADGSKIPEA